MSFGLMARRKSAILAKSSSKLRRGCRRAECFKEYIGLSPRRYYEEYEEQNQRNGDRTVDYMTTLDSLSFPGEEFCPARPPVPLENFRTR